MLFIQQYFLDALTYYLCQDQASHHHCDYDIVSAKTAQLAHHDLVCSEALLSQLHLFLHLSLRY